MERIGPGQLLFQVVRYWSRRWTGAGDAVEQARARDVMVTEAAIAQGRGGGTTVNAIAAELGIDQSGASRMVSQAIAGGYLAKEVGPDRRQRSVRATPEGLRLVEQAHAWQEQVFAGLTAGWTDDEVAVFTELMCRLASSQRGH